MHERVAAKLVMAMMTNDVPTVPNIHISHNLKSSDSLRGNVHKMWLGVAGGNPVPPLPFICTCAIGEVAAPEIRDELLFELASNRARDKGQRVHLRITPRRSIPIGRIKKTVMNALTNANDKHTWPTRPDVHDGVLPNGLKHRIKRHTHVFPGLCKADSIDHARAILRRTRH